MFAVLDGASTVFPFLRLKNPLQLVYLRTAGGCGDKISSGASVFALEGRFAKSAIVLDTLGAALVTLRTSVLFHTRKEVFSCHKPLHLRSNNRGYRSSGNRCHELKERRRSRDYCEE
jgi:hypothetical protein